MRNLIGVYSAGGYGREILPLLRKRAVHENADLVFVDDGVQSTEVNAQRVLNWESFLSEKAKGKSICLAPSDPLVRKALWEKCENSSIDICGVSADNVVILDKVEIGTGCCLSPFVTLTSNIKIGRAFHANIYSYVGHDCVIGDFVTFAPGAKCNGNVVVEEFAYIGTGAVIKQGQLGAPLTIGKGAVVGMGAIVTKDVPPGQTVVGNPARPLR